MGNYSRMQCKSINTNTNHSALHNQQYTDWKYFIFGAFCLEYCQWNELLNKRVS
uniref:Uncharacterized protein n=2 Tax=Anguilla anguilla TaxID=7936 RepID=A0A0E9VF28_ANGAN